MATTTFNTRISLKYDTYANWVEKDPVLLAGEVAVVVVPADTNAVEQEPATLFKVGDGTSKFSELQFVAGLAADVYDWAKAATKPTYSASEIDGLSDYISGEIQDTDTQYKLEVDADNDRKFHLYSQEKGKTNWTLVSTITIPDETVYTLVEGTANGTVKFNGTDVKVHGLGTAAYKDESAFDASGAADTALESAKTHANEKVSAEETRAKAAESANATAAAEAKTAADNAKSAADAAQADADAAQADVDALEAKVGTVPDGKTVVEMISDAEYDDTALAGRVTTVEGKVTALVGDDANKSARAIAAEEVAKIVDGADASYDTLKEIADWISGHKTDAAAMNSAILALEAIVDGIGGDGEKATVVAYVTDAIAALNIGDYAKASELTTLAARVTTLEGKTHEHSNKTVLDGITSAKVTAWDGAVEKEHEHANKTVLDGVTAEKVADWDSKAAGDHEHDITELKQASGYIVLNCGSASVNI